MKKIILTSLLALLFIAPSTYGQSVDPSAYNTYYAFKLPNITAYANFKKAAVADTLFADSTGLIRLTDSLLTIDKTTYQVIDKGDILTDSGDFFWQILTLSGGIACVLRRYPNYALMNIIIQPDSDTSLIYYIR